MKQSFFAMFRKKRSIPNKQNIHNTQLTMLISALPDKRIPTLFEHSQLGEPAAKLSIIRETTKIETSKSKVNYKHHNTCWDRCNNTYEGVGITAVFHFWVVAKKVGGKEKRETAAREGRAMLRCFSLLPFRVFFLAEPFFSWTVLVSLKTSFGKARRSDFALWHPFVFWGGGRRKVRERTFARDKQRNRAPPTAG